MDEKEKLQNSFDKWVDRIQNHWIDKPKDFTDKLYKPENYNRFMGLVDRDMWIEMCISELEEILRQVFGDETPFVKRGSKKEV